MLYVIDQRLKAQGISLEKSAQGKTKAFFSLSYLFVIFVNFFLNGSNSAPFQF